VVEGGEVVVVNGPSGAGKTSVLSALAEVSDQPWVLFDEPVIGSVDQAYLIWRDQAPVLHAGFLGAIAALARRGNLVAVAAAGHPAELVSRAFENLVVVRVGLDCDMSTLRARERGRAGRWGGLAADSMSVHNGWTYDARFDTTRLMAATIAGSVLDLVNQHAVSPCSGQPP
jgi:chloramphenicol 3-O-phosphotransferase